MLLPLDWHSIICPCCQVLWYHLSHWQLQRHLVLLVTTLLLPQQPPVFLLPCLQLNLSSYAFMDIAPLYLHIRDPIRSYIQEMRHSEFPLMIVHRLFVNRLKPTCLELP